MASDKVFFIAEAGVNHNGDRGLLLSLIDTAARAGADAVKFQTFTADKLVAPGAKKAEYQARETGNGDQHSMLLQLELTDEMHHLALQRCKELGIEFLSTPFDEEALDYLIGLGIKRIKVPSGEITNIPYIEYCAAKGLPIIISTGMADLGEVEQAVSTVRNIWARTGYTEAPGDLTVLHCTSNYPASADNANLRAMETIAEAASVDIGYSDHTEGIAVSVAAAALGAKVIEKHFTLDRTLPGPDHKASLEPSELEALVAQIRTVEQALGRSEKQPNASELPVREVVRKSVTLNRALAAGETVSRDAIVLLRPGNGIQPMELNKVVGRALRHDLPAHHTLQWDDLV